MSSNRAGAGVCLAVVVAAALAIAAPAAARERPRVAVLEISGRGGAQVRARVVEALRRSRGVELVARVRSAAYASELPRLARVHRLDALVTGQVTAGKRPRATLFVWRADGSSGGKVVVAGSARALPRLVGRQVEAKLVPLLRRAGGERPAPAPARDAPVAKAPEREAPAAKAPEPEAPAKEQAYVDPFEGKPETTARARPAAEEPDVADDADDADDATAETAPAARPHVVDLAVGLRIVTRSFSYAGAAGLLPGYSLRWAPAPSVAGDVYPLALAGGGALAHLGVTATYERAIASASRWSGVQVFPTTMHSWSAGAKARVPLHPVELSASAAYGVDTFAVAAADRDIPKPTVPDVAYRHVRLGGGLRFQLSRAASVAVGGAWLHVLSAGELVSDAYFPAATGRGYDANAVAAYRISRAFEARLRFDLRQYDFALRPAPSSLRTADTAADRYLGVTLGLSALL